MNRHTEIEGGKKIHGVVNRCSGSDRKQSPQSAQHEHLRQASSDPQQDQGVLFCRDKTREPFTSYFPFPLLLPHLPPYSPLVFTAQLHKSLSSGPEAAEPFLHLFCLQSCPQTLLIHTMCKNSCGGENKNKKGVKTQKKSEWEFQVETETEGN